MTGSESDFEDKGGHDICARCGACNAPHGPLVCNLPRCGGTCRESEFAENSRFAKQENAPEPEDRAAGITAHFRANHAERENAEMTAWVQRWAPIIEAAKHVSLDHSCGLEGWDEACAECRFAKLMYAEGGSPENVYPVHEVGPETVDEAPDEHLRTHDGWDIVAELRAALQGIKDYADECVANADRVSACTVTIAEMARKALR